MTRNSRVRVVQQGRLAIYEALHRQFILPVFFTDNAVQALCIVSALYEAGVRVVEFTDRGPNSLSVFQEIANFRTARQSDLILGAGTVTSSESAALFVHAGADFIVSPSFGTDTVRFCNKKRIPYIPGCSTAREIQEAEEWGTEIVKLFPASADSVQALAVQLAATSPKTLFMPSGGIDLSEKTLKRWVDLHAFCISIGSDLIGDGIVDDKDSSSLTARTEAVLSTIHRLKA